ncbi:hypothetical protein V2J52_03390 [Georgenia sp. MJ173]|uniref:hypothetical protein n=1 Tax=Georgenia sunbinii TaxID=3117728 RepID=UPI002F261F84
MRTTTHRMTAALVLGVALFVTGCSDGPPAADATTNEAPVSEAPVSGAAATTAPAPATDLAATQEPALELLSGPLPSGVELDRAVGDALDAYLAHRALYDAAAQAGFADEEVVDELLATTSGDLREAIQEGVEHFTSEGLAVDGSSEVLDIEAAWLHFPASALDAPEVTFEACVRLMGGPAPEDEGASDELALTVRMTTQDSRWVVWSQRDYGYDCDGVPKP